MVERQRASRRWRMRSRMKSRGSWKPCSSRQGTRQPPSFSTQPFIDYSRTMAGGGDKWRGARGFDGAMGPPDGSLPLS